VQTVWGRTAVARDRYRKRIVVFIMMIVGSLLVACSSYEASSSYDGSSQSDQSGWRELIIHGRHQLFAGSMFCTQLGSVDVRQSVSFILTIQGSRVPIDPAISRPLKLMPVLVGVI
jgi:hypothetical protein